MSDKTYTQGLWRVLLAPTQIVTDDKVIANVNKELLEYGESLANARLIAAAPELLEALEYALGWFKSEKYESALTEQMTKAIAKAKGES